MKKKITKLFCIMFVSLAVVVVSANAENGSKEKLLIINADDYGMCHSFNTAIETMLLEGTLTSASIMVPCPWFPEAAKFCRRNPNVGIGVHLTLTSEWEGMKWRPVTTDEDVSSLVDANGYFYSNHADFKKNAKIDHIRIELKNQIEIALNSGIKPNHLNDHMGALSMMGPKYMKVVIELFREYKLPYRLTANMKDGFVGGLSQEAKDGLKIGNKAHLKEGLKLIDYIATNEFFKVKGKSYDTFRDEVISYMKNLPYGITEYFIHPSVESDEIKHISPDWEQRLFEYRVFRDPVVRKVIAEEGIKLVDYSVLSK